ncbi:MAG: primosomal protein N' [Fimbriimonadaceae bacterium]|nr:primosomal protein N' [Fimbriimonadaceae bacterium]
MNRIRIAEVGIEARVGGADAVYTYRVDESTAVGQAVIVPLGSRQVLGIILDIRTIPPSELGFDASKLKPIAGVVRNVRVPEEVVGLLHSVANRTISPISQAVALAIPPGMRKRMTCEWKLLPPPEGVNLSTPQAEALRVVQDQGGTFRERPSKPLTSGMKRILSALRAKGFLTSGLTVDPEPNPRSGGVLFRLTANESDVERFLKTSAKKKPAQCLAVMRLQAAEHTGLSSTEIKLLSGVTDQGLKALQQAGLIEKLEEESSRPDAPKQLNEEQAAAFASIAEAVDLRQASSFLLFGITGSGKTEVYLQAAERALKQGRRVLFVVPEIALTAQVIAQLRGRFGRKVAILHSALGESERIDTWLKICRGDIGVVVGTRSAIFAPIDNLGLIVVDEEHETSYKQDTSPRYHAKPVALELAARHRCPIVLGSATPSIETFQEARVGRHHLLKLTRRIAEAKLPTVEIVDLAAAYREGRPAVFSEPLLRHLKTCLANGHQAILFLNRRAYSPVLVCRDCGFNFPCPNCAVSMAYHRHERSLRCHHCDHRLPEPDFCPSCGGSKVSPLGIGVERIEEAVRTEFPDATIARLDRDVARRKGAVEEIFAQLRSGEIQVLVGTQMVAKGLDFPRVALVGVVVADIGLNLPDFRASERTFQLLAQVSGRAGRGEVPGHVVIQTFNPGNEAILRTETHDFEGLYHSLIEERKRAKYPPFVQLVNVILSGPERGAVQSAALHLRDRLAGAFDKAFILGPADCPLERLAGNWRKHLLVKLPVGEDVSPLAAAQEEWRSATVKLAIDVDPYSLM